MKIIVHGAAGHMGRIVLRLIEEDPTLELACAVDAFGGEGFVKDLNTFDGPADCIIDFSHHSLTDMLTEYAVRRGIPLVLCTTGQTAEERETIAQAARNVPIFFSANMSPAIAMLADMARTAAAMFPDADIEIVEKHHNRKVDVPSGTALILAHAVEDTVKDSTILIGRHENGRRKPREIAVHSLRIGNEVGTHEIIIATGNETITLKHEAEDRALFADGAIRAASYIVQQAPGKVYEMKHLVAEQ